MKQSPALLLYPYPWFPGWYPIPRGPFLPVPPRPLVVGAEQVPLDAR
jgi:hypothetical protein